MTFLAIDQNDVDALTIVFGDDFHRLDVLDRQIEISSAPVAPVPAVDKLHKKDPPAV